MSVVSEIEYEGYLICIVHGDTYETTIYRPDGSEIQMEIVPSAASDTWTWAEIDRFVGGAMKRVVDDDIAQGNKQASAEPPEWLRRRREEAIL